MSVLESTALAVASTMSQTAIPPPPPTSDAELYHTLGAGVTCRLLAHRSRLSAATRASQAPVAAVVADVEGLLELAHAYEELAAASAAVLPRRADGAPCAAGCMVHGTGEPEDAWVLYALEKAYAWPCASTSLFAAFWLLSTCAAFEELGVKPASFFGDHSGGLVITAEAAMVVAGADPLTLAAFLDPAALHMREGVVQVDSGRLPSTSVWLSHETLLVLVGADLSTDDQLKIGATTYGPLLLASAKADASAEAELAALLADQTAGEGGDDAEAGGGESSEDLDALGLGSDDDANFDVAAFVAAEMAAAGVPAAGAGQDGPPAGPSAGDGAELGPYASELEYLKDEFEVMLLRIQAHEVARRVRQSADGSDDRMFDRGAAATLASRSREVETRLQVATERMRIRTRASAAAGFVPRLRALCAKSELTPFETSVLVACAAFHVYEPVREKLTESLRYSMGVSPFRVSWLLSVLTSSVEDSVRQREAFLKAAPLVRDGYITVTSSRGSSSLIDCEVNIERRVLDHIVGLALPLSELVEGTHLYTPVVSFDDVVLPREQLQLIIDTIESYPQFCALKAELGLDELIAAGSSMVLLFHGVSGTGKTMAANAVAHHLGLKVLLVNFASLAEMAGSNSSVADAVTTVFAEAKMHNALVFFDECELLFETRKRGRNSSLPALLTLLEKFDGVCILATNLVNELDEATFRRTVLQIELAVPDHVLRRKIWKRHIPAGLTLAPDVDLGALALKYELTGGYVKQAVIAALSAAITRSRASDAGPVVVAQVDLEAGAQLQLESRLRQIAFERRVVPRVGLDGIVLPPATRDILAEIVASQKAVRVLGTWGFAADMPTVALFHGKPGLGKTLAAEVIGFETGRALRVVNVAELMSKYVGETAKNIEKIFSDASGKAILVFDEAEGLFAARTAATSSSDRHANIDTGLLLYHLERFGGVAILTTNNIDAIDPAFLRRIRYIVEFEQPGAQERAKLWRLAIPPLAPLAEDVDFGALASRFELSGADIRNAVYRAATSCASDPAAADSASITMAALVAAAEKIADRTKSDAPAYLYL